VIKRNVKRWATNLTRRLGYEIHQRDPLEDFIPREYLQSPFLPKLYRQSAGRMLYFKDMLDRVRHLEGDIVECGVSIGHGILYFMLLSELIGVERRVFGFDSFAGFPSPSEQDRKTDATFQVTQGYYASPGEMVDRVLRDGRVSQNLIDTKLHLVQGFFADTLTQYTGQIVLLHLDCDFYDSYKQCLGKLFDKVVSGGFILLDEYEDPNYPGAQHAVDEFLVDKVERIQVFERYGQRKAYIEKR
jgi:hypothetical protein